MNNMVFLKLGGSVITNKDRPNSADLDMLDRIAGEIAKAQAEKPELSLVIGHGSGSFGHHAANKYGTREGVSTPQGWLGFTEVAARARELNQIVIERLLNAGLKVVSLSAFSAVWAENHRILTWDTTILEQSLLQGLIPVLYGDVILDKQLGGIILSTEELFSWLALKLRPDRILLAGLEAGVWMDFPARVHFFPEINSQNYLQERTEFQASKSIDVTGGMSSKVEGMISLVQQLPSLEVQIFTAKQPGNVYATLMGDTKGTLIRNPKG